MSADEELGIVYMPVELPTADYYGGHRRGERRRDPSRPSIPRAWSRVDIKTGQKKWHYQLVHHGIWDHDIPCAPILMDLVVNGKPVKAVAQPTKQNWLYVFDRATGKPVWPIEERPVEKGDVPGEWYSPTQPFVTKPDAYERQGVTIDDLIDYTPELRAEAVKLVSQYKLGPIFTPPVVGKWEGPRGTLMLPDVTGGANWQGGSFDPETKRFYIFTNVTITQIGLVTPEPDRSDMLYVRGAVRNPNPPPLPAPGAARCRRRWRRLERARPAAREAAVRDDHRDRHEQGRSAVEDSARRYAGQRQEQPGVERRDDSANRTPGPHRRADDEDVADRRRGRLQHHARWPRRVSARVRQGDRRGRRARCSCRRRRPDRR